jgi:hypothetical protein
MPLTRLSTAETSVRLLGSPPLLLFELTTISTTTATITRKTAPAPS